MEQVQQPRSGRRPVTLAELLGARHFTVAEAATLGLVLLRQLAASGVHLGHADPELFVLGSDGFRVIDREQRQLAEPGLPTARSASWFAPEFARGLALDGRTDVYVVALTVIGGLCRRSPFLREDLLKTLLAAAHGDWSSPLRLLRAELPVGLVDVLMRAADADPLARPSALELERRLASFVPSGPGATWSSLARRDDHQHATVPDSDEARLVRADELEEQGAHDDARWVRLECHLARASGKERAALKTTLGSLGAAIGPARVAAVSRAPIERCPVVVGGACPGSWDRLEVASGTKRTCHECGCTVTHVLDVPGAQTVVFDGGTVAIDVAAERTHSDLDIPDSVMNRT